jgi:RHS repeat-associated protein
LLSRLTKALQRVGIYSDKFIEGIASFEKREYNGFGQLVCLSCDGLETQYRHCPDGLRHKKIFADGSEVSHIWDGPEIVAEYSANGAVHSRYFRGAGLIAREQDGQLQYYLFNAHGDVVERAGATGAVLKRYDYDAFGCEINAEKLDANPFRYCSEYWDKEAQIYYLRARDYCPGNGRFTREDPIFAITKSLPNKQEVIDSLSLHKYIYANNNPVTFKDSSGKYAIPVTPDMIDSVFRALTQVGHIVQPFLHELGAFVATYGAVVVDVIGNYGRSAFEVAKDAKTNAQRWLRETFSGGNSTPPSDPNNWNHRDYFLKQAQNKALKNAIGELYRTNASIGDGGTADILRYEIENGVLKDGRIPHLQKAQGMIKHLNDILINQKLSDTDSRLTRQLLNDLYNAVKMAPR